MGHKVAARRLTYARREGVVMECRAANLGRPLVLCWRPRGALPEQRRRETMLSQFRCRVDVGTPC